MPTVAHVHNEIKSVEIDFSGLSLPLPSTSRLEWLAQPAQPVQPSQFHYKGFSERLIGAIGQTESTGGLHSQNWVDIGRKVSCFFRRSPYLSYLFGALQPFSIYLKIVDLEGEEVHLRVRRTTAIWAIKAVYCDRKNLSMSRVTFFCQGERIADEATPAELGMEDEDRR